METSSDLPRKVSDRTRKNIQAAAASIFRMASGQSDGWEWPSDLLEDCKNHDDPDDIVCYLSDMVVRAVVEAHEKTGTDPQAIVRHLGSTVDGSRRAELPFSKAAWRRTVALTRHRFGDGLKIPGIGSVEFVDIAWAHVVLYALGVISLAGLKEHPELAETMYRTKSRIGRPRPIRRHRR